MQTNSRHILFSLGFILLIYNFCNSQENLKKSNLVIKAKSDNINPPIKSIETEKVQLKVVDTTKTDSIVKKKRVLDQKVKYNADGYTSVRRNENKTYLYDKAVIKYGDYQIDAGIIVIDYTKNLVYAGRIKDSVGEYTQKPILTQAGNVVESDSVQFNFKTKRSLVWNSKTEQQGGTIFPTLTKKENDSVFFISKYKYTTAEDTDNPDYYFYGGKAKFIPGEKIVTGPINLYIADVPTPIGVPFGFFPLSKKRSSGIIFPTFGEQNDRGYFIQNAGYYFPINDYVDLAILGDYYTNGSFGLRAESTYSKRYNYRGNVGFRYENLINSERGLSDFTNTKIFNFRWTHSKDSKANPNSTFSASVNIGSSSYFQESLNQLTTSSFLNNTLASSISYSRRIETTPEVNVSLTATHSQNTQSEVINLTLPTLQASVDRVYPFAPKVGTKKGILENINLQYSVRAENSIQTTDSLFLKSEMFENSRTGARHSIPINTNFKVFKYFSFSANANFEETWTLHTNNQEYDSENNEIVTTRTEGFDAFRTYNYGASLGTTVYGEYTFGKNSKVEKIRHVMRPSLSYNINPAFDQYYETFNIVNSEGITEEEVEFTRFQNTLFGTPTNQKSSSLGLSIGNNIEAKIRSKDSTDVEPKKIALLNNLSVSTAYNFEADSLKLSPIRVTGGTQLFNNKLNLNFGAVLDPYALDNNNIKINTFNINNGGSLTRLTSANLTASYNFSSDSFKKNNNKQDQVNQQESIRNGGRNDDLFGVSQDFANRPPQDNQNNKDKKNDTENYNYKIPWSLNLAYSLNYSNATRNNEISSHSINFSGNIELSPLWSIGLSSGYDVLNKGVTFTQFRFQRDLKSWNMNFTWVPFSARQSWNFFIGIKSSILSDLKYEKRRQPDQEL